jgi:hypothetical protein
MAHKRDKIKKDKTLRDLESFVGIKASPSVFPHIPYSGKFRSQLVAQWILTNIPKASVADIGGGKGQLAYFLMQAGWSSTVIDPNKQDLLKKYTDVDSKKRIIIPEGVTVPNIQNPFEVELGKDFDVLVGLHAHGSNAKIIDAAEKYHKSFVLIPCCVIDEPFYPSKGVTWVVSLADYAMRKGFHISPFVVNFSGQNIGIYGVMSK